MNWDTYKTLSPKLKEEWNFRFGEDRNEDTKVVFGLMNVYLSVVGVSVIFMAMVLALHNTTGYVDKGDMQTMITTTGSLLQAISVIVAIVMVYYIGRLIVHLYCIWRFYKKNNIKIVNNYTKFKKWLIDRRGGRNEKSSMRGIQ